MIGVIIQARMGSSRLPGKVLKDLCGVPMLEYQLNRVFRANSINKVVVATTTLQQDDPIQKLCDRLGVSCFRGSEDDVLSRYFFAAKRYKFSTIVRLTADCPLVCNDIIDICVNELISNKFDYFGNTVPPETSFFPDGSDVEVFTFEALERAHLEVESPKDREHVTFHFWKSEASQTFKSGQIKRPKNIAHLRWTVDYPEDYSVVCKIAEYLEKNQLNGSIDQISAFLQDNPDIVALNEKYFFGIGWQGESTDDK